MADYEGGHVFISYVREDTAEVDALQGMLEAAGLPVWRDTTSLWPGEDWSKKIRDAITCDALVFIACFSSHSIARQKSYQNSELRLAIEQLKLRQPNDPWLIPVRFDECALPDFGLGGGWRLDWIQRADLFGPNRDLAAARLVSAIRRMLGQPAARSSAPLAAETPDPGGLEAATAIAPGRKDLAGEDLWNTDLSQQDLRGADLRGAQLHNVNLAGADLTGADLTGVVMTGGSLLGATLTGSKWNYAAILGAAGIDDPALAGAAELAAAAIPGRDKAEVMIDTVNPAGPCVFSPDGSLLAFGSGREVKIADASTGSVLRILRRHQYSVTAVAYSHDGVRIAAGADDGAVHIWDAATGAHQGTLAAYTRKGGGTLLAHTLSVTTVAFSRDGVIATGSADATVALWDSWSGTPRQLRGANGAVRALAFSPDGTLLVTASNDPDSRTGLMGEKVSIWHVASGECRSRLAQGGHRVKAITFSPAGDLIAFACRDGAVRVWDAVTATERATLRLNGSVLAVGFRADASLIATASSPRPGSVEVHTWDAGTGASRTSTMFATRDKVRDTRFSPQATLIAITHHSGIIDVRGTAKRAPQLTTIGRSARIPFPALSPGGTRIATQSGDGIIAIWDAATITQVTRIIPPPSQARPYLMAFSPDGARIATQSSDRSTRIWDTATGTQCGEIAVKGDQVTQLRLSANGIAAGPLLHDRRMRVWDITEGTQRTVIAGRKGTLNAFGISPDGSLVAISRSNGAAWLADASSGVRVAMLLRNPGDIAAAEFAYDFNREFTLTAIAFSPDGKRVAGASEYSRTEDGIRSSFIRVWNIPEGLGIRGPRLRRHAPFLEEHTTLHLHHGRVTGLAFSPNSDLVASAAEDCTVQIWPAEGRAPCLKPVPHDGPVHAVAFSADGKVLMTMAEDCVIRYLDTVTGATVCRRVPLSDGGLATLLPDGSYDVNGEAGDDLWWAIKLCHFVPGQLDPYCPEINKLPGNAAIFTTPSDD